MGTSGRVRLESKDEREMMCTHAQRRDRDGSPKRIWDGVRPCVLLRCVVCENAHGFFTQTSNEVFNSFTFRTHMAIHPTSVPPARADARIGSPGGGRTRSCACYRRGWTRTRINCLLHRPWRRAFAPKKKRK